jgi:putative transcriptional regulator
MSKEILEVVHESAKDLYEAGVLGDVTLKEFDALCLPPVREYSAGQIKQLRQRVRASQGVFAAYLNTSVSTVQKWERGVKKPNGPSLKLLNLVDQKGLDALA